MTLAQQQSLVFIDLPLYESNNAIAMKIDGVDINPQRFETVAVSMIESVKDSYPGGADKPRFTTYRMQSGDQIQSTLTKDEYKARLMGSLGFMAPVTSVWL